MSHPTPQPRLVGFVQAVTAGGDYWRNHGTDAAEKLGDAARRRAFILSAGMPTDHDNDSWKMEYYTRQTNHPDLNTWRGGAV